ncbi:hypothetical protein CCR97_28795 [Rhodoplanes elegans]|uniref:HTH cro/C1-type domain-containing protein n=2 Tax=Rhodoplanes elegans TaxID=29408 RepID=A0A327K1H8_9BRAD|nr:S24 family peptidase [Rhodoplanes elegans]MBK5962159.1 hypothetical protein [Rhodoplanes elegans]RAI32649.1 hypothetical protein CH338_23845 [Rhodoplanes elegans]
MGNETQAAFAARADISQSALNRILNGGDPSLDTLIAIANAGGVSVGWLATGESIPADPGPEVRLRRLAFRASAGNGTLAIDEEVEQVPFSAAALRRVHLKAENARFMIAEGDSMRPTIEDGDPLVVDIADTDIIDGRIYVFSIGDQALVKRLRRRGSKLYMRSDNRELFPDEEEVPTVEPVRIIGRVRWVGRSL